MAPGPPPAVWTAGGAALRVGLNSTRSTVSLRAATPPVILYSGKSDTVTGATCGSFDATGSGSMLRPQSVSYPSAPATITNAMLHSSMPRIMAPSFIVDAFQADARDHASREAASQ